MPSISYVLLKILSCFNLVLNNYTQSFKVRIIKLKTNALYRGHLNKRTKRCKSFNGIFPNNWALSYKEGNFGLSTLNVSSITSGAL